MGITFGLIALALLLAGLYYQRKQKKSWVAEERYDESGAWIDKRSSERGTYGALDAEREQERKSLAQQGRVNELARLQRAYCFDQYPGFNELSDAQIKSFTNFARRQAALLFQQIEALQNGQIPEFSATSGAGNAHLQALKKITLDFSYAHFPKLLDLDIELLQGFDQLIASMAATLLKKIPVTKG